MKKNDRPFWFTIKCRGEFVELVRIDDLGFLPAHYNATKYAWTKYSSCDDKEIKVERFFEPVSTSTQLKLCPKCGTETQLVRKHIKSPNPWRMHYFVCCCNCKYRKNNEYNKPEKAIADWNSY